MQDIRDIAEQKLAEMLARNASRMNYQLKYEEIVAGYNSEKDRVTLEETFRNWTHIGHEKAGPRLAAILSVVETCRRLKIPVRAYLTAVLPGLANSSIQKLPELTPTAWAANNL